MLLVEAPHAGDRVAFARERFDRHVPAERDALRGREARELLREALRIARLVAHGEDAAGKPVAARAERRLDRDALVHVLHVAVAAELAHQRRRGDAVLELPRVGVEREDAAFELVVLDPGRAPQLLQAVARVEREVQALDRVAARARRQAFEQELQPPPPLARIEPQPEQERRVFPAQPLQDLRRRLGIRPGFRVRRRDLAAVRERRLERRRLRADRRRSPRGRPARDTTPR